MDWIVQTSGKQRRSRGSTLYSVIRGVWRVTARRRLVGRGLVQVWLQYFKALIWKPLAG